jgi:hypothetical protein
MWKRFFRRGDPPEMGASAVQETGMRRRFGRRRQRSEDGRESPIDARWLERVVEAGLAPAAELARVEYEDVPPSLALVARGRDAQGEAWVVAVAPESGGDALLAGLVASAREGSPGSVLAVAEAWDGAARRRLALVRGLAEPPRARVLAEEAHEVVAPEVPEVAPLVAVERLEAQLGDPAARTLFARGVDALRGLAAKHGGALRATASAAELVILARRVAALRPERGAVVLETFLPGRQSHRPSKEDLAEHLDRLEGFVRKRLNDREVREGEEGLRGRALGPLVAAAGLRSAVRWPLGGADLDTVDLVGVAAEGRPVVAAVRRRLTLRIFGELLDAGLRLEPWLPVLLAGAGAPVLWGRPRLVLAAAEIDAAVSDAARFLDVELALFDLEERGAELSVRPRAELQERPAVGYAAAPLSATAAAPARTDAGRAQGEGETEEGAEAGFGARRGRRRRRRRGGSRPEREAFPEAAEGEEAVAEEPVAAGGAPFEELSLFDLDDESASGEERRGRRRGRGRGRRGGGAFVSRDEEAAEIGEEGPGREVDERGSEGAAPEEPEVVRGRGRRGRRRRERAGRDVAPGGEADDARAAEELDEDDEEALLALSPDAPELEEAPLLPAYDDEEEEDEDEEAAGSAADRTRLEREQRRLARLAKLEPEPARSEPEAEITTSLPRGRVAILAHADRQSIAAAVMLAREWRQVEGIWIYPQSELMTFFRGVATDLRENTPILVVGFTPTPARDALQAAALYRGRIAWFDHHDWPPEDRGALAAAIGAEHLHLVPGAGSALPVVLAFCARRSRFSDKLVDLATGRFSQHDFQRWGRQWWWRLGELARKTGERRADLELLLAGRPSDLTKEAERLAPPPVPEEIEFVRGRDFRLVHFGGLTLSVVDVPEPLDVHLTARLVRERYGALLSLARCEGDAVFALGADDAGARRPADVGSMIEHLVEKFDWLESLPDTDHVARLRIRDLAAHPERIEEVIAEIGMGRSILEG